MTAFNEQEKNKPADIGVQVDPADIDFEESLTQERRPSVIRNIEALGLKPLQLEVVFGPKPSGAGEIEAIQESGNAAESMEAQPAKAGQIEVTEPDPLQNEQV